MFEPASPETEIVCPASSSETRRRCSERTILSEGVVVSLVAGRLLTLAAPRAARLSRAPESQTRGGPAPRPASQASATPSPRRTSSSQAGRCPTNRRPAVPWMAKPGCGARSRAPLITRPPPSASVQILAGTGLPRPGSRRSLQRDPRTRTRVRGQSLIRNGTVTMFEATPWAFRSVASMWPSRFASGTTAGASL
jgi:hypothetical protein